MKKKKKRMTTSILAMGSPNTMVQRQWGKKLSRQCRKKLKASAEPADDLGQAIADATRNCASEKEKQKLKRMLEDHNKLLYPNCEDGKKKLGTTLELLQWKAENGIPDKAFEKLLIMLKKMLPKDNELPDSMYEAKKAVCPLGLEVQKIHACPNDCILYRGAYEEHMPGMRCIAV